MKPCTNCARPGKLMICLDCAERAESILRPLVPWTKFFPATLPTDPLVVADGFKECYKNSRYQVIVSRQDTENGTLVHMSIKRIDKSPIHDWRDLQRIKNELLGPEQEAMELYPAESRLVDAANQYHLYSFLDKHAPFGYEGRVVSEGSSRGAVQRPFEERPLDALTTAEIDAKLDEHNREKKDRGLS